MASLRSNSIRRRWITGIGTATVLAALALAGSAMAATPTAPPTPALDGLGFGVTPRLGLGGESERERRVLADAGRGGPGSRGGFRTNDPVGAAQAQALGINDRGKVVGIYLEEGATLNPDGTPPEGEVHGFLGNDGTYRDIDVPGASYTQVEDVNDRGRIVGLYLDDGVTPGPPGIQHGFLLNRASYTDVDFPGASATAAGGVTGRGQVVGAYVAAEDRTPDDGVTPTHGFLRGKDGFTTIDAPGAAITKPGNINNRGQVVGTYVDAGVTPNPDGTAPNGTVHGFLRDKRGDTTVIDFPGASATEVEDVNNRGQIVGTRYDASGERHAFVRSSNARRDRPR